MTHQQRVSRSGSRTLLNVLLASHVNVHSCVTLHCIHCVTAFVLEGTCS